MFTGNAPIYLTFYLIHNRDGKNSKYMYKQKYDISSTTNSYTDPAPDH